jgi:hypothetical protein
MPDTHSPCVSRPGTCHRAVARNSKAKTGVESRDREIRPTTPPLTYIQTDGSRAALGPFGASSHFLNVSIWEFSAIPSARHPCGVRPGPRRDPTFRRNAVSPAPSRRRGLARRPPHGRLPRHPSARRRSRPSEIGMAHRNRPTPVSPTCAPPRRRRRIRSYSKFFTSRFIANCTFLA